MLHILRWETTQRQQSDPSAPALAKWGLPETRTVSRVPEIWTKIFSNRWLWTKVDSKGLSWGAELRLCRFMLYYYIVNSSLLPDYRHEKQGPICHVLFKSSIDLWGSKILTDPSLEIGNRLSWRYFFFLYIVPLFKPLVLFWLKYYIHTYCKFNEVLSWFLSVMLGSTV